MVRIVVIGAGFAGINFAQSIAKQLKASDDVELIIIEKKKFFFYAIGAARAYVDVNFLPSLFIPYENAIPKASTQFVKIIRGIVEEVSTKEISYKKMNDTDVPEDVAETLKYDYLIVATGSTYAIPTKEDPNDQKRSTTEAKFIEVREKIEKAEKILIIGGGAVGCEVAGEIAYKFPDKTVTLLEGRDKLVSGNDLKDKFRRKLTHGLEKLKVKIILGERLSERITTNGFEKKTLTTDKGTKIESDIQLVCVGFNPATKLIKALDASLVAENGAIKVTDTMKVDSDKYNNIYVLGDASNHPTPKLGYWAGEQAKHLAKEFVPLLRKKIDKITKPFPKPQIEAMLLPLGPKDGVSQLPIMGGYVTGRFLTVMIKSKDYFAGNTWKSLNAIPPKYTS
jgi:NADH dehydrogenase FAD-containing subunit